MRDSSTRCEVNLVDEGSPVHPDISVDAPTGGRVAIDPMSDVGRTLLGVALVVGLLAAPARAADQHVVGKLVMVRNNLDPAKRLVKYLGKEIASSRTVQGSPLSGGATFEVVLQPELGSGSQQCFALPASGWSAISSIGYKYRDATGTNGPVKVASIKRTPSATFILKVVANGALGSIVVVPPTRTAEADVFFHIGGGGDRYCSVFGGDFVNDGVSLFKAKNAPAPSACADVSLECSPSGAFVDGE
jgi:hypothetical protein